jgi:hypothetical protein
MISRPNITKFGVIDANFGINRLNYEALKPLLAEFTTKKFYKIENC